jgi:hypothetical protein
MSLQHAAAYVTGSRHHFGNYVSEGKSVSDRFASIEPGVIEFVR